MRENLSHDTDRENSFQHSKLTTDGYTPSQQMHNEHPLRQQMENRQQEMLGTTARNRTHTYRRRDVQDSSQKTHPICKQKNATAKILPHVSAFAHV